MPCVYVETEEEKNQLKAKRNERLKSKLDEVTRFLCSVLRYISETGDSEYFFKNNPEILSWWESHKQMDKQRINKLKESAKSKLTPEEIKALGLS